ncbi:hypothetical protein NL676_022825 [Syzygium grande]|nr:hypothetical protein NL676_022825 [Syzygium grande]
MGWVASPDLAATPHPWLPGSGGDPHDLFATNKAMMALPEAFQGPYRIVATKAQDRRVRVERQPEEQTPSTGGAAGTDK